MVESVDDMIYTKNNDKRKYTLSLNKLSNDGSNANRVTDPYHVVQVTGSDSAQAQSNLKIRPRPPTFTYIEDIDHNAPGKIIDFDNPTSGVYLDIDGLNRFLDEFLNNYNSDSFNAFLNYAQGQANGAGHECGPTHDENVKWRLRNINSQNLQPMLRTVNGINGIISNNSFISNDLKQDGAHLNEKISMLVNRLQLLYQYNNNTLGTPEQIVSTITAYFQNLINIEKTDTDIINKNNAIVLDANSKIDAAIASGKTELNVTEEAVNKAKDTNGYLWKGAKDKVTKYYHEISDQNDLLTDKKEKVTGYYTKMERQFEFQQANVPKVSNIQTYLYIVYYALIVVWIFFLFRSKNGFSLKRKIGFILILLLFPFMVYYIEMAIHGVFRFLYSFVTNKPFNNKNFNYDPTKGDNYQGDVLSRDHVKTTDVSVYNMPDSTNGFDQLEKSNLSVMSNNPLTKFVGGIRNYFEEKIRGFNFNNILNRVVNGA